MEPQASDEALPVARGDEAWRLLFRQGPAPVFDRVMMAALGLGAILYLAPHRAKYLNTTDSFLFALGTEEYDLARAHPHPPGYPVFVFLSRIATAITADENAGIVAISIFFAAVAVALLYGFVREFATIPTALIGSLLFLVSPNLVYNSALALSYTAEGALSVALAWAALRVRRGRLPISFLGALFGIALGVRPSSLFFLTPILAWSILPRPYDVRTLVRNVGQGVVGGVPAILLWFVPMLHFGGGFGIWWETTQLQSRTVVFAYTVFNAGSAAIDMNVARLRIFLESDAIIGWVGLIAALVVLALYRTAPAADRDRLRHAATTIGFWALPAILFFTFIFSGSGTGPRGYILTVEPALFAAFAVAAETAIFLLAARIPHVPARRSVTAVTLAALLLVMIPLGTASEALVKKEVRDHDAWSEAWLTLRKEYPPNETAVLASHSWAFAKWYLPDYTVWSFMPINPDPAGTPYHFIMESRDHVDDVSLYDSWLHGQWSTEHPIPESIQTVILFDFQLAGENDGIRALRSEVAVEETHLENGWRILLVRPDHSRFPTVESMVYLDDTTPQPR